jgi:hypothetical protein
MVAKVGGEVVVVVEFGFEVVPIVCQSGEMIAAGFAGFAFGEWWEEVWREREVWAEVYRYWWVVFS